MPPAVPSPADLRIPDELVESVLTQVSGLILVSGLTGSGKTHTAYSLADTFNLSRSGVVYAVTDGAELAFSEGRGLVVERVKGDHHDAHGPAIERGLRMHPHVILVDELRDAETVRAALHAANSGHLVVATAHASTPAQAVARLVELAGEDRAFAARAAAEALVAVSNQTLVKSDAGLTPAFDTVTDRATLRALVPEGQSSTAPACPHCGHAL